MGKLRDSMLGELIADRYVLRQLLGEGGMGRVFLARHELTGRAVALKLMAAEDRVARERALREARSMGMTGDRRCGGRRGAWRRAADTDADRGSDGRAVAGAPLEPSFEHGCARAGESEETRAEGTPETASSPGACARTCCATQAPADQAPAEPEPTALPKPQPSYPPTDNRDPWAR